MVGNILTLRDWGVIEVTQMREGHQVQQFTVNPGACIPLRVNDYQCEHWVIIHGTGRMQLEQRAFLIDEGDAVFLPARAAHQVENISDTPLRIMAIQYGPERPLNEDAKQPRHRAHNPSMFQ